MKDQNMKKGYIIIINVIIIAAILIFVVIYSGYTGRESYRRQIEYFENTTVTMEQVTENYLEGEQRVCDVWARYINNRSMTMEEAAEYIRASHVLANTSAHLISLDTRTGLSTRPKQGTDDDYVVSYERVDILNNMEWTDDIGKSIRITRAYTNPMNGEQSLAFCNTVDLYDAESLEAEFDRFNEYYPNVEMKYTKIDDYNNMIGTVLNGNDAPDIYVNYSWMYGRDQYKDSIDHAEDLSDPKLGLDIDCIRSNIILNTDDGKLPMVPIFANTYGMLVNNSLFEKEGLSVPTTYQELVEVCDAFRKKGYDSPVMGFSNEETTSIFILSVYPFFCGTVAEDEEAVKKLNALDPSAGEYMRPALEKVLQFKEDGCTDLQVCGEIENNYDAVILRFFEGDVPMMTGSGDTVSGTEKRESRSEAFIAEPFKYSFVPIPMSDEGANFLDMPNLQFSVNKDSGNLDMANEFMRFLITSEQLNEMAQKKGLMSPTKDLSSNRMYSAFEEVPASRIVSPEEFGLTDDAVIQLRQAVYGVGTGAMTIDEAVAGYGSFSQ